MIWLRYFILFVLNWLTKTKQQIIFNPSFCNFFQNRKVFLKPYSECPFYGIIKNGITIEYSSINDEKIRSWDRCKICDTEAAGEATGVGWAKILIELL